MDQTLRQEIRNAGKDLRARHDRETIESVIEATEAIEGKHAEVTSKTLRLMVSSI